MINYHMSESELYYKMVDSINDYGYSGSGSGNGNGSGSGNGDYKKSLLSILLALSPLILVGTACIIFVIIIPLVNEIIRKYKNIKYKYKIYFEERNNPTPIKNNKLSQHFIKKCNKTNMNYDKKSLDCSICLDEINIEDYKTKPNDLLFLNCSHVFHTNCIQSWTSSQVKIGRGVNCPLCRDHIVMDIPKIIYRNNSVSSDDSVASYWND
jgi:hypothetical protein